VKTAIAPLLVNGMLVAAGVVVVLPLLWMMSVSMMAPG